MKIRCKWYFQNKITEDFSNTSGFKTKSNGNPPKSHPALEMFLSKVEPDMFSRLPSNTKSCNLSKEEWQKRVGRGS